MRACKYGLRSAGIGLLKGRCPKKPCKWGARYPNEYQGVCPKESAASKAARKARVAAERERARKVEEIAAAEAERKRQLNLLRAGFTTF